MLVVGVRLMLDTVAWIGLSGNAFSVTVAFCPVFTLLTSISAIEVFTTRPVMLVITTNPLLLLEELDEDAEFCPLCPVPLDEDCELLDEPPVPACWPTAPLIAVTVPGPGAYSTVLSTVVCAVWTSSCAWSSLACIDVTLLASVVALFWLF